MNPDILHVRITSLAARVPEGVPVEWQGREFTSGPLLIELNDEPHEHGNQGCLNYSASRAYAEFNVLLKFPEFAGMLQSLGVDSTLTQPVRAVLRSEGEILEDHSFAFSGHCELRPHALFWPEDAGGAVLPGR